MKMEFPGQEPFEKDIDFLDALEDKNFGESFVKSVKPEGLGSGAPIPEVSNFIINRHCQSARTILIGTTSIAKFYFY